jgi:hypothetical protein
VIDYSNFVLYPSFIGCSLVGRSLVAKYSNLFTLGRSKLKRSFSTSPFYKTDFNGVNIKNLNLKDLGFSMGETYIFEKFFENLPSIEIPMDSSYAAFEA